MTGIKKFTLVLALLAAVAAVTACTSGFPNKRALGPVRDAQATVTAIASPDSEGTTASPVLPASPSTYGSAGALADESLTLEEMLVYALQDEYAARAEYEAVIKKFGSQRPFSNIINSEVSHIGYLLPLFEKYGYVAPKDTSASHVVVPASIAEALRIGVQAEIVNIDMYNRFLKEKLPDDVKAVFLQLRDASQNHLNAFSR